MRRVPLEMIKPVESFVECPQKLTDLAKLPQNKMLKVEAWKGTWERNTGKPETYGWDN